MINSTEHEKSFITLGPVLFFRVYSFPGNHSLLSDSAYTRDSVTGESRLFSIFSRSNIMSWLFLDLSYSLQSLSEDWKTL